MDLSKVSIGKNPPHEINVFIEIAKGVESAKYELDKESGALFVDRFLSTAMFYPGNYGFIPHTLSNDGDPCDVLVVGCAAVMPGVIIRARPIGVLFMEDESGMDEKIIAVPNDNVNMIKSYEHLSNETRNQITHFFGHYKDLDKGKWVNIANWGSPEQAKEIILEAVKRKQEAE
ncbi:MAG: Inorganic pyrophosphatase [Alphaproteobacteria bacterium ADurb.Bin438]|nr:MAG: Inorganic pyrophosphatase [Alphaproteobacteria bacterium ADurb.Bin438]